MKNVIMNKRFAADGDLSDPDSFVQLNEVQKAQYKKQKEEK